MAERRMFAKTIVLSDAFLDMPLSARCLYFTLGMMADDDGFVNSPKSIIRQCGASEDDLKVLLGKKFVLAFENGVIVIKHWRINNYLRNDRYKETVYAEEKNKLTVDANGTYHGGIPYIGIPSNGIPSIDKDSIDKDIDINTIVQNSLPNTEEKTFRKKHSDVIDERFEQFWKVYPRKQGKGKARDVFNKINPSESLLGKMMTAVLAASVSAQWKKDNGQFIPLPATWLNQERWEDEINPDMGKPDPKQTKGTRFANFEQRQYTDDDNAIGTAWLKKG